MKKQIDVVGAVVLVGSMILCARRGGTGHLAGMWEFPGGKIEPGETPREALVREIEEELHCLIAVGDEVTTTAHEYDFAIITLTTFWCDLVQGQPRLTEHGALLWSPASELRNLHWAPADIPAVRLIEEHFARLGKSS